MKCPECHDDIGNDPHCACGWTKNKRKRAEDGIDHRKACAFEYRGEKCQRLGTMSHGTKGEGPWYCRDHFFGRRLSPWKADVDWRQEALQAAGERAQKTREAS